MERASRMVYQTFRTTQSRKSTLPRLLCQTRKPSQMGTRTRMPRAQEAIQQLSMSQACRDTAICWPRPWCQTRVALAARRYPQIFHTAVRLRMELGGRMRCRVQALRMLCYVPNMDAYTGPGARSSFPRSNYAVPSQYYQQLQSLQQQNHAPTNLVQRQPTPPVQANQSPALPTAAGVQVGPRRLYFSSLEQAKNALENRIMSSNTTWEPNTADSTIPRHDTAQAQYVCQLVSAMEDVTAAQDSIRHWQHDPAGTKMPYYHPSHVEKVCWVLVSRAVQLHTRGPRTLATYDASALRNARLEQRLTFAQRINAICALLRYSKSRCDRLMKGETFEMVVGAPQHLLGQSRMNKNQNEVKQSRLRKGVEIEKKLRSEACPPGVGGDEGVVQKRAMESDDSEEDAVASSQRKRAKR